MRFLSAISTICYCTKIKIATKNKKINGSISVVKQQEIVGALGRCLVSAFCRCVVPEFGAGVCCRSLVPEFGAGVCCYMCPYIVLI